MLASIVVASTEMWMLPVLGVSWLALGLMIGKVLYAKPRVQTMPFPPRPQPQPQPIREVPATEPGPECRVYPRYETRQIRLLIAPSENSPQRFEGLLINQSMGGLCICLDQPLPEGSYIHVRSAEPMSHDDWVPVQIRYCRSQRGGWAIGCQFANGQSNRLLFT